MDIIKKDGSINKFDLNKIVVAIQHAMWETEQGEDTALALRIAKKIECELLESKELKNVDEISDIVELKLMASARKDVAKTYISYRALNKNPISDKEDRLLTDEFISKYKHQEPPMKQLGNFIYLRTYSRWLIDEQRREHWWETVRRSVEYNCGLVKGVTKEEAEKLFDNIYNLKQFLSGRTFWVGGTSIGYEYGTANYNCAACIIDDVLKFKELFYLLMVGAGVGFRVLIKDVEQMPKIRTDVQIIQKIYTPVLKSNRIDSTSLKFTQDSVRIYIGDSKEGWTQALEHYFNILTQNEYKNIKTVTMDYDNIRPKGERLKRFGGTASGYMSLRNMFEKITMTLRGLALENEDLYVKLRPIHCLDICNIIGENVVVGGVRRTAEVGLIDVDDQESIQAKNNLYYIDKNGEWQVNHDIMHRGMSNNSIVYETKPSREQLEWQIEQMKLTGEPGFFNLEAAKKRRSDAELGNPCVTGDTKILTKSGYMKIEDLVDESVEIWNGFEWSVVTPKITGHNEDITELYFSDGNTLECTEYHKFHLRNGSIKMAKDLEVNDKLIKCDFPIIEGVKELSMNAYTQGFYSGDGTTEPTSSGDKRLYMYGIKQELIKYIDYIGTLIPTTSPNRTGLTISGKYLEKSFVPNSSFTMSERLRWLGGLIDSDGSIDKFNCIQIAATDKEFLMNVKYMLNTMGCNPKVVLHNRAGMQPLPDGHDGTKMYDCKTTYRLIITMYDTFKLDQIGLVTYRVLVPEIKKPIDKRRFIKIEEIRTKVQTANDVYCFNEPKKHTGIFGGVITGQCMEILLRDRGLCNLSTNVIPNFIKDGILDLEALKESFRLSVRASLRMTCLKLELHKWNLVQEADRLLGCSMTGWQDAMSVLGYSYEQEAELQRILRDLSREEADRYAEELGIPKPLLITTLKPEGTLSLLAGVSSGIHYSHSPYFIRRVRISAHDPLVKVCEELGYPVFPENGQTEDNCTTKVIEFVEKSPATKTKDDVTAIEQLEGYKRMMRNYADHNVSITVTVRDHEWGLVTDWVDENWDEVVAVTFLALAEEDSMHQLMPLESISEEEYNRRSSEMKPFRGSLLSKYETQEVELDIGDSECVGGVCPIR